MESVGPSPNGRTDVPPCPASVPRVELAPSGSTRISPDTQTPPARRSSKYEKLKRRVTSAPHGQKRSRQRDLVRWVATLLKREMKRA